MHIFIIYWPTSAQCTATAMPATNINDVNIRRLDPSSSTSSIIHFISINISRELRRTYYVVVNFVVSRHSESRKMRLTWRTDARLRARFSVGLTMASYLIHEKTFLKRINVVRCRESFSKNCFRIEIFMRTMHLRGKNETRSDECWWIDGSTSGCGEKRDPCERFSWASRKL